MTSGLLNSCGGRQVPEAAAPATRAIDSGLTRTEPCPVTVSACSASLAGTGTEPENIGTGWPKFLPSPKRLISFISASRFSDRLRSANVVGQAKAKLVASVPGPLPGPVLVIVWSPTAVVAGQSVRLRTVYPLASSASAETGENAMPGM